MILKSVYFSGDGGLNGKHVSRHPHVSSEGGQLLALLCEWVDNWLSLHPHHSQHVCDTFVSFVVEQTKFHEIDSSSAALNLVWGGGALNSRVLCVSLCTTG